MNMKRILSVLICLTMIFSLTAVASAQFRVSPDRALVEPVIYTDENGNQFWGMTKDDDTLRLPIGQLTLTTLDHYTFPSYTQLSPAAIAVVEKAYAKLVAAYDALMKAENLNELFGLPADHDYVVVRLFDLSPVDEGIAEVEKAFAAGGALSVQIKTDLPDAPYYFATLCEDEWVVLDADQVKAEGNDVVTLTFEELCPVALIQQIDAADDVVQSPQTSPAFPAFEILAVVCAGAAVVCFVIAAKKRANA